MNDNLDKQLCEKYPKIFKNRYAPMADTCMCWGFEIGDGWYQIIDSLCANIQHTIDYTRKQRHNALVFNRALKKAINGDKTSLSKLYTWPSGKVDVEMIERAIIRAEYRHVHEKIRQVVAIQVKEKFGGLRFYCDGGNDQIFGMVRMAESWASHTCDVCGAPGKSRSDGWVVTRCDAHYKPRDTND